MTPSLYAGPSVTYYNGGSVGSSEEGGYSRPYLRFGRSDNNNSQNVEKNIEEDENNIPTTTCISEHSQINEKFSNLLMGRPTRSELLQRPANGHGSIHKLC